MNRSQWAAVLGCPEAEILDVDESAYGPRARTIDGNTYLWLDEPDAAGQTGLMFEVAPSANYRNAFPVHVPVAPPYVPPPLYTPAELAGMRHDAYVAALERMEALRRG